jgi:threonine/homoserine/homoserine lactone efflux protein
MPTIETTAAFFGVAVLLALAPGPDNLFVMVHSIVHGRRAGMLVVLGLCTGLVVHTSAVALGLAAVFAASATAFQVLKLCGAAYLLYLAYRAFRAPAGATPEDRMPAMGRWRTYGRGVVMNVSNPKVAVFFLAFLPQFVNPAAGNVTVQVFFLGGVFIVATLLTFGAIANFSGVFGNLFRRSPRARRVLNWAAGAIFVALAARLAAANR